MELIASVSSSSRRSKPLISSLHCLVTHPGMGKASGDNPEEKSEAQFVTWSVAILTMFSCDTVGNKFYTSLCYSFRSISNMKQVDLMGWDGMSAPW